MPSSCTPYPWHGAIASAKMGPCDLTFCTLFFYLFFLRALSSKIWKYSFFTSHFEPSLRNRLAISCTIEIWCIWDWAGQLGGFGRGQNLRPRPGGCWANELWHYSISCLDNLFGKPLDRFGCSKKKKKKPQRQNKTRNTTKNAIIRLFAGWQKKNPSSVQICSCFFVQSARKGLWLELDDRSFTLAYHSTSLLDGMTNERQREKKRWRTSGCAWWMALHFWLGGVILRENISMLGKLRIGAREDKETRSRKWSMLLKSRLFFSRRNDLAIQASKGRWKTAKSASLLRTRIELCKELKKRRNMVQYRLGRVNASVDFGWWKGRRTCQSL